MNEARRIHEQDFCAAVAGWATAFLAETDSPFASVRVEGYGTGEMRRKRKDLRMADKLGGAAITGEVRLPGADDDDPYGPMADDAAGKAANAGVQYFFTWNVNTFVLWDHSRFKFPLLERRVGEWPPGLRLRNAAEVGRPENEEYIKVKFRPTLLLGLGRIYRGWSRSGRWRRQSGKGGRKRKMRARSSRAGDTIW